LRSVPNFLACLVSSSFGPMPKLNLRERAPKPRHIDQGPSSRPALRPTPGFSGASQRPLCGPEAHHPQSPLDEAPAAGGLGVIPQTGAGCGREGLSQNATKAPRGTSCGLNAGARGPFLWRLGELSHKAMQNPQLIRSGLIARPNQVVRP
jgi:hypothetical protein